MSSKTQTIFITSHCWGILSVPSAAFAEGELLTSETPPVPRRDGRRLPGGGCQGALCPAQGQALPGAERPEGPGLRPVRAGGRPGPGRAAGGTFVRGGGRRTDGGRRTRRRRARARASAAAAGFLRRCGRRRPALQPAACAGDRPPW